MIVCLIFDIHEDAQHTIDILMHPVKPPIDVSKPLIHGLCKPLQIALHYLFKLM